MPPRAALVIILVLALAGCAAPPAADDAPRSDDADEGAGAEDAPAFGDAEVVGQAPERWHLEGLAFHNGTVASGTAFAALGDPLPLQNLGEPSRIYLWDRSTGELEATLVVEGEDTMRPHAIAGLVFDAAGRLYALSSQLGLTRWTRAADSWAMETLAQLPDIPPCAIAAAPCSPTLRDEPPIGNDLTFGPDGSLYVSDSFQATVWRILPDGTVEPWAQDARFDRKFGPNGLRVSPDGTRMMLAITGPDSLTAGPLARPSTVFSIPFPDPAAGEIETFFTLPNGDLADGIAYGARGDLYVASNAGNRIFVVAPDGSVNATIENADLQGDAVMDFPASLGFDGEGWLLVANYAYSDGNARPEGRTVIAIYVDDVGSRR